MNTLGFTDIAKDIQKGEARSLISGSRYQQAYMVLEVINNVKVGQDTKLGWCVMKSIRVLQHS
jgi:hypothetical protein